ncbi:MAG: flagellar motor switch protein FliN, partial [Oscillospiraceae bacterium]|nr:flagellar motor switch protein FliN [Oscillospiraceae bacterium]
AAAPDPAPGEEAPATEAAPAGGGKMSQDDIAALFAANAAAEPEPAPVEEAPATEAAPAGGGKMSQDAIEALLNSMAEEASK